MENGHAWKEIANAINKKFVSDDLEHKFGRTPENVKDKWKQLGGEHGGARNKGPWGIEEALDLLRLISVATDKKLIKSSVKVSFLFPEDPKKKPSKRMQIIRGNNEDEDDEGSQIKIYDRSV